MWRLFNWILKILNLEMDIMKSFAISGIKWLKLLTLLTGLNFQKFKYKIYRYWNGTKLFCMLNILGLNATLSKSTSQIKSYVKFNEVLSQNDTIDNKFHIITINFLEITICYSNYNNN